VHSTVARAHSCNGDGIYYSNGGDMNMNVNVYVRLECETRGKGKGDVCVCMCSGMNV
jgi:hypothetical protein